MEEINTSEQDKPSTAKVCIQCGNPDILEAYPNALCNPCRQSFIKFTVPLWVKLFGGGVLVLLFIALFEIPRNFATALALERAEKAETEKNYLTEQRELEKVIVDAPTSLEVSAHLMIAAFYNNDYKTFYSVLDPIAHKTYDDTALVARINALQEKVTSYLPDSAFTALTALYKTKALPVPDTLYDNYLKKNPGDLFAHFSFASQSFENNKYKKCDSLLDNILSFEHNHVPALTLKTIVKRELGQLDSSLTYCNKVLYINRQNIQVLSSKTRTILKQGKKTEGLKMALKNHELDKNEPYTMATLVLAYHLNGMISQRDALLAQAAKDSLALSYMQYPKDIISGKTKF